MEIRALSDARIIEFLSKSPIKSFAAIQDALSYLDGQWVPAGIEYELFHAALGDNQTGEVAIRIPQIGGNPAAALFRLSGLMQDFNLVRRRPKARTSPLDGPEGPELIAFYELTPAGRKLRHLLMQVEVGKQLLEFGSAGETESA